MAWFAVSLILPVWAAYAPVAYCDREARNGVATRFFRVCLATGIGIGISSVYVLPVAVLRGCAGQELSCL